MAGRHQMPPYTVYYIAGFIILVHKQHTPAYPVVWDVHCRFLFIQVRSLYKPVSSLKDQGSWCSWQVAQRPSHNFTGWFPLLLVNVTFLPRGSTLISLAQGTGHSALLHRKMNISWFLNLTQSHNLRPRAHLSSEPGTEYFLCTFNEATCDKPS